MTPDTAQTDKTGPETRAQADPAYEDAEVSECRAGSQKTDIFQADARRIFEAANDRPLMPWSWMLNTCQTTHCLNPDHLITHAPLKINGPNPEGPVESRTEPRTASDILRMIVHGRHCGCDLCTTEEAK